MTSRCHGRSRMRVPARAATPSLVRRQKVSVKSQTRSPSPRSMSAFGTGVSISGRAVILRGLNLRGDVNRGWRYLQSRNAHVQVMQLLDNYVFELAELAC